MGGWAEVQPLGVRWPRWNLWLISVNLNSPVNLSGLSLLPCKMDVIRCALAVLPARRMRNRTGTPRRTLCTEHAVLPAGHRRSCPAHIPSLRSCYRGAPGHVRGRALRVTDAQSGDSSGKKGSPQPLTLYQAWRLPREIPIKQPIHSTLNSNLSAPPWALGLSD